MQLCYGDESIDCLNASVDHILLFLHSIVSGTSMSSPYVAGAFALLFNMTGGALPGQDARRRFINTAVPGSFFNSTKPAPVAKQGSGLINVKDALTSTVRTRNG
jgi:subtilisin family serine protease